MRGGGGECKEHLENDGEVEDEREVKKNTGNKHECEDFTNKTG